MTPGSGHPLAYPLVVTIGTLAICSAWAPFADPEQLSMLAAVALTILGYTAFRLTIAFGVLPACTVTPGNAECKRVRQQHRLSSRSWLEFSVAGRTHWLPVYFDPALVTVPESETEFGNGTVRIGDLRLYPSGPLRDSEPAGRLIDNPTRPDPDGPDHAAHSARYRRRLLLDAQYIVTAPFAGLLWVYSAGGGLSSFLGAATVSTGTVLWFAAIRGSDPS